MTSRPVALRVEELNARDLPSAATAAALAALHHGPSLAKHLPAVIAHHVATGQNAAPLSATAHAHLPAVIAHHVANSGTVMHNDHVVQHDPSALKAVLAAQLHGRASGAYTVAAPTPDAGTGYGLSGTGTFAKLGDVTVAGSVQGVGMIQQGHAGGTLTLTNAQGSVTLQLTGPPQGGFATLPHLFKYQITGGTGAYANEHGHGALRLNLLAGGTTGQGSFTLAG